MAKLYWRIKKNGRWTWQPAEYHDEIKHLGVYTVIPLYVQEEETVEFLKRQMFRKKEEEE